MDKSIRILSFIVIIFSTLLFVNAIQKSDSNLKTVTHENYKIQSLKLSENLNFAGERVHLENKNVREEWIENCS